MPPYLASVEAGGPSMKYVGMGASFVPVHPCTHACGCACVLREKNRRTDGRTPPAIWIRWGGARLLLTHNKHKRGMDGWGHTHTNNQTNKPASHTQRTAQVVLEGGGVVPRARVELAHAEEGVEGACSVRWCVYGVEKGGIMHGPASQPAKAVLGATATASQP